jgi:hypothetical protein
MARAQTQAALDTLIAVMQDETAPPAARVSAAIHLLDRGHGRPELRARVEHHVEVDLGERLRRARERLEGQCVALEMQPVTLDAEHAPLPT